MNTLDVVFEVCDSCRRLDIPVCAEHDLLLCVPVGSPARGVPFQGRVGRCPSPACKRSSASPKPCPSCAGPVQSHMLQLPRDELDYALQSFSGAGLPDPFDHSLLVCAACRVMGFPGSSNVLCTRTAAQPIVTHTGRNLTTREYTMAHLFPGCGQASVTTCPVALSRKPLQEALHVFSKSHAALQQALMLGPSAALPAVPYLLPRLLPYDSVAGGNAAGIRSAGLRFFSQMVRHLAFDHASAAGAPLAAVASVLSDLGARGPVMFRDWAPPREPPTTHVAVDVASATSSGSSGPDQSPDKALGAPGYWSTPIQTTAPSTWQVKLAEATLLHAVEVEWECSTTRTFLPASYAIRVSADGKDWTTLPAAGCVAPKQRARVPSRVGAVSHVLVAMVGAAGVNSSNTHGIARVHVLRASSPPSHVVNLRCLQDLQAWLNGVAGGAPSEADRLAALNASLCLTGASASTSQLLALVGGLLAAPDTATHPDVLPAAETVVGVLKDTALVERAKQADAELHAVVGGPEGSVMRTMDARFVTDAVSGSAERVDLREMGQVAHSTSGSHSIVYLDKGPFTSGKASWEMQLVEDTNSQCTCFGLAQRPVTNCNYERSPQMWMYRAYNGYRYSLGTCDRPPTSDDSVKVKKGDTVRCDLDMEAGTMSFRINDRDMGVVFSNLQGQSVYPAVQFYSSGRTVKLLQFQASASLGPAARPETSLSDLQEQAVRVGYGAFGKAGDLGYNEGTLRHIIVGGKRSTTGLSTHPPPNHAINDADAADASVTYFLNAEYDTFRCEVALNDDVPPDMFQEHGSPLRFQVLGDGEVLWTSEPVAAPGASQRLSVSVLEVHQLQLRAWCAGSNRFAHAVWVAPTLQPCADWSVDGWRNDKATFVDAMTGTKRGEVSPLPHVNADASTTHSFAVAALTHASFLANEYMRGMRTVGVDGDACEAPVDLESPYAVEVNAATLIRLADLITQAATGRAPNPALLPLLRIARANLRRLCVSRVDPIVAGLDQDESGKVSEDSEHKAEDQPPHALRLLQQSLATVAASGVAEPEARALVSHIENMSTALFTPSAAAREAKFRALVPTSGVVELQLAMPCHATFAAGKAVAGDTLVLLLQLHCKRVGWSCRVMGRWPAVVYVVMDVPASFEGGVVGFLSGGAFGDLLDKASLTGWSFPDGVASPEVQLSVEPTAAWDRRSRLAVDSGMGAVRVYPAAVAQFDAVVSGIRGFLPPL